jgi:hypothetical protein
MSTYFKDFPVTGYSFGNNLPDIGVQNISAYVEIIDNVKNLVAFYTKHNIQEGDRPDQVSTQLYNTPDYYWTFFLMNDNIREQGWPLTELQLKERAAADLPHRVLTTTAELTGKFKVGQTVSGSSTGSTGKILKRNLDLGQLVIDASTLSGTFNNSEVITSQVGEIVESIRLTNSIDQANATKHYIDETLAQVDIDPHSGIVPASYTPVTNLEFYRKQNDSLKAIRVIKPAQVGQITKAFREELS